jgi:hypothetical protein
VKIPVQLEPMHGAPRERRNVEYRWDRDTEILSAQLTAADSCGANETTSESVGVEGTDGSWLILDVAAGAISGVEIAVWPEVLARTALTPPTAVEDADARLTTGSARAGLASLETETHLIAEADGDQRTFHFRLGSPQPRSTRTVRLGRDLLLDVDEKSHISGLWLLNVPPCPTEP